MKIKRSGLIRMLGAAAATAGLVRAADAATAVTLSLDRGRTHQMLDHFGANDAWYFQMLAGWSEENKTRLADLLFSTERGIGLSFCRFHVGAGINRQTIQDPWRTSPTFETGPGQYDWNRLPGERWFLRAAKARGVKRFGATFYSPPARMTRNGLTNHGQDKSSSTNLKPGHEPAYARYLADILAHFKNHPDEAERTEFYGVFPVNEPKWDWQGGQEGCRYSNEDLQRLILALDHELRAAGLRTRIFAPESGSIGGMLGLNDGARKKWQADYGDYLNLFSRHPGLTRACGKLLTYHSYWSDRVPDQIVPEREELARRLAAMPGWTLWQSEYCVMEHKRDLGMETALRVARVIHCDLAVANASAWQWWLAVASEDFKSGLIHTDYQKPGDEENILLSKIYWVLGNYSRYLRPGAVRLDLGPKATDTNGLMVTAWRNAGSEKCVFVAVNCSNHPIPLRLAAAGGMAPGRFFPVITSEDQSLQRAPAADLDAGYNVPARSVVTFIEA